MPRFNRPPLDIPMGKPVIVYVAGRPEVCIRYLNKWDCSDTEYYRLQVALIRAFAARSGSTVVVKLFPESAKDWSPVEQLVRDMGAKHLYVSRAPFKEWLPWAERVIMDFPSTPLYETALAKVPFRLLVHRSFPMRAAAWACFAPSLIPFDQPEEAARSVMDYLQHPAVPLPYPAPRTVDLLIALSSLVGREPVPAEQDAASEQIAGRNARGFDDDRS